MNEPVADHPLFVLQVSASCDQSLDKLKQGLLECHGTVLVEVNEGKKEVRVKGNVQPLELLEKTQKIMGGEAKLCYYNRDPARIPDFKSESNGKEKEEQEQEEEEVEEEEVVEEEDHYKPYVYKDHKPVNCPTSMSGKEFYDYFRSAGSKNHKRNAVPTVDPSGVFPDYSPTVDPFAMFPQHYSHSVDPFAMFPDYYHSNNFNSSVPMMPRSPYPPHFY